MRVRKRDYLIYLFATLSTAAAVLTPILVHETDAHAQFTARGFVQVTTPAMSGQAPQQAFPDIAAGDEVTVVDSSGTVVSSGILTQGMSSAGLVNSQFLDFTLSVPAGLDRYGIRVGLDRGTVWFTREQMRAGPELEMDGA